MEKYDKKVMNFMGADFDDEDPSYFDSFAKDDQIIATLDILNREAGPVARTLLKEGQDKGEDYVDTWKYYSFYHRAATYEKYQWYPGKWKDLEVFDFFRRLMESFIKPYHDKLFYGAPNGVEEVFMDCCKKTEQYYKKCDKIAIFTPEWNKTHPYSRGWTVLNVGYVKYENFSGHYSLEYIVKFINRIMIYLCLFRCLLKMDIFKPSETDSDGIRYFQVDTKNLQNNPLCSWTKTSKDRMHVNRSGYAEYDTYIQTVFIGRPTYNYYGGSTNDELWQKGFIVTDSQGPIYPAPIFQDILRGYNINKGIDRLNDYIKRNFPGVSLSKFR